MTETRIENRDALLAELTAQLGGIMTPPSRQFEAPPGAPNSHTRLGCIKVTLFEDGEELTDMGLDHALEVLVEDLTTTGNGTDITQAERLELGSY